MAPRSADSCADSTKPAGSQMKRRTILAPAVIGARAGCATQSWQQASLSGAYGSEIQDFGLQATNAIRIGDREAPTPLTIEHVQTITTVQLRDMMLAPSPPLLIDVINGGQTVSLPGAIWLRGAGLGDD